MPPKRRKGKQVASQAADPSSPSRTLENTPQRCVPPSPSTAETLLVLTSDKRRGVYECDYCHSDISQVPRIRCAVCPDFDLCLDCFVTTDHSVAVSRIRAASAAHGAVQEGPTPGISASAVNHSGDHRYRVADSTRYPLFPSSRMISKEPLGTSESMDIDDIDDTVDSKADVQSKLGGSHDPSTENTTDDIAQVAVKEVNANNLVTSEAQALQESMISNDSEVSFVVHDDPKAVWTIEEDLRLLDAISVCGLGNWPDVAEAIGGQGSSCKTPKRCMERYFDDFLGRYGHILPPYTIVEDDDEQEAGEEDRGCGGAESEPKKRRMERMSSFGLSGLPASRRGKKLKVVPTPSIPSYEKVWPDPYFPPIPEAQAGQEVGRDRRYRAEQLFVKLITNAATAEEAEEIRREWNETRLNQPGGPTALPIRQDDLSSLPGSELAGFMPRRGDFDMEWDNDAENILADMEFTTSDSVQDRELKIKIIQIYNAKLDERERRKNFLLSRGLLDYRKNQQAEAMLPRDERDLLRRMRLFERFHTPEEHKLFIDDILRAKRLRKEIALLQTYRRMGIKTLAEAERYENDKARRQIHKMSFLQKETETGKGDAAKSRASKDALFTQSQDEDDVTSSLWKQYRTSDRKNRRSVNRSAPSVSALEAIETKLGESVGGDDPCLVVEQSSGKDMATTAAPGDADFDLNKITTATGPTNDADVTLEDAPETRLNDEEKDASVEAQFAVDEDGDSSFPIAGLAGYDLLTRKEADLCRRLHLKPQQYLAAKKAIIHESFRAGLLEKECSHNCTIFTIDVRRQGEVVDFMVRAGWISSKVGDNLKQ